MAYAPEQSLAQMLTTLATGITTAGVAYTSIWGVQTGINKLHQMLTEARALKQESGYATKSLFRRCELLLHVQLQSITPR